MILEHPNVVLTIKCEEVKRFSGKLKRCVDNMKKYIRDDKNALGLAAPQVGIPERFFVCYAKGTLRSFVNPEIVDEMGEQIDTEESCLSIPGKVVKLVKLRNDKIQVEAQNLKGQHFQLVLHGTEAIVFQHELDHCNGLTILDRESQQKQ